MNNHCDAPSRVPPESPRPDLSPLIARVEAATGPDRELDAEIAAALCGDPGAWVVIPSSHSIFAPISGWYRTSDDASHNAPEATASLDAALALVERMLPGAKVFLCNWPGGDKAWAARLVRDGDDSRGPTPAIALILALLRALQANASASGTFDGSSLKDDDLSPAERAGWRA